MPATDLSWGVVMILKLFQTKLNFHDPEKEAFENIVVKGENARNQYFLLFPQCFPPYQRKKCTIRATMKLSSAYSFNLDEAKILSFSNELTLSQSSPGFCVSVVQVF